MANTKKNILFVLSLIILCFVLILIWLNRIPKNAIDKEYQNLATKYVYDVKHNKISEIVSIVYTATQTGLKNGYKLHRQKLAEKQSLITLVLSKNEKENWCEVLRELTNKEAQLEFSLKNNNKVVCQSENFIKQFNNEKPLESNIYLLKNLPNNYTLKLEYQKDKIHNFVKNRIAELIRDLKFKNPDIYVWVNEIKNYDGGDDYAIRRVHPNLIDTEGMLLSTHTQDAKGNFPYLDELNAIKKDGEAYYEYYFKKKTSDKIERKLAYGKLFKPFDWIIATGIYVEDIESIINEKVEIIKGKRDYYSYIEFAMVFILSGILVYLVYKKETTDIDMEAKDLEEKHTKEKIKNYQQVLYSMLDIVEKRDTYTAGHTQRVARYAVLIAEEMQLSKDQIDHLYEAAIMHDIGKISTPDSILLKPGKLTSDEYKIIQQHLTCGYEILHSVEAFHEHAEIMRNHHERYDGKGYPRGLKGDEIPILSHILIIVDAYDAMTSKRIYKESKSLEDALIELENLKGKQFSPEIVDIAIPILKKTGVIPAQLNYLETSLEEARVAYYYKDSLTGLYNFKYLEHILFFVKQMEQKNYKCCYLLETKHFHTYNKEFGWFAGDEKLIYIANQLNKLFPKAIIFRVFGDDFLILFETHHEILKKELFANINLQDNMLELELHHVKISSIEANDLKCFIEAVLSFVHSIKQNRR